jgi:uncharacterized repeat protein (TIGR01451 family)
MRISPAPAPTGAASLSLALLTCLIVAAIADAEQTVKPAVTEEARRLVQDLSDARFPIRQRATDKLRTVGIDALPALEEATQSGDPEVRARAWRLIDEWAAQGKVPALLVQLTSGHGATRASAADNLGKLGAAARAAVPALTKAARNDTELVRCSAREALKNIQAAPELSVEVVALDENGKVGDTRRYQIEVGNTGSAPATQVRIEALVPPHLTIQSVVGPESRTEGQRIISVPLTLEPNSKMRWEITTKVSRKANVPLAVDVRSEQLTQPLRGADNMPAQTGLVLPQLGPPPLPPVQLPPADPVPQLPAPEPAQPQK